MDQKFSNVLQEAFVWKLSLWGMLEKELQEENIQMGWALAVIQTQARRLERKGTEEQEQRHQGEPGLGKGAFQGP